MNGDYSAFAGFAQTWGLLYFILLFLGVVLYAFWPSHKKEFDEASRIPLRDD